MRARGWGAATLVTGGEGNGSGSVGNGALAVVDGGGTAAWPAAAPFGDQLAVRSVIMRGGTSRGVFFDASDLPPRPDLRDRVVLAAFGSPDARQIDGVGGAHPLTSKVAIVSRSARADADVDYLFGQVRVDEPVIDYSGNCGNLLSAVGPFAIDEALVPGVEPVTVVRIHVVNTGHVLQATVPVRSGIATTAGTTAIAGVPGTGAAIVLDFAGSGSALGRGLLPTGRTVDDVQLPDGRTARVSVVDAGNPSVFVPGEAVGLGARELVQGEVDGDAVAALVHIRGHVAAQLGLVDDPAEAERVTPALPKVYAVHAPCDYVDRAGRPVDARSVSLVGSGLSMGRPHPAYAVTAAVCTATAACLPGTVVARLAAPDGDGTVRIGHPSGVIEVGIDVDADGPGEPRLLSARIERTARRLASGVLYVPRATVAEVPA